MLVALRGQKVKEDDKMKIMQLLHQKERGKLINLSVIWYHQSIHIFHLNSHGSTSLGWFQQH